MPPLSREALVIFVLQYVFRNLYDTLRNRAVATQKMGSVSHQKKHVKCPRDTSFKAKTLGRHLQEVQNQILSRAAPLLDRSRFFILGPSNLGGSGLILSRGLGRFKRGSDAFPNLHTMYWQLPLLYDWESRE